MHRSPTITIPQPCHESWAAMTPTAQGRHCAACQKTVVDFTTLSDPEILAYLQQSAGGACGRFRAGQLARPLQPLALAPAGRWRTWALSLATVLGLREMLTSEAQAQQAPVEQTAREPIDMKRRRSVPAAPAEKVSTLRGQVLDKQTNEGLPGVTVLIAGSTVGTSTNSDGTFELALPEAHAAQEGVELQFHYLGYVTEQRMVPLNARTQLLRVEMQTDVKWMGEVVITRLSNYGVLPPAPWRPRALFGWAKHWVTRPFQRY